MKYIIKPVVCDYAVIEAGKPDIVVLCNIKRNAELIADILNADCDRECAHSYDTYKYAKFKITE